MGRTRPLGARVFHLKIEHERQEARKRLQEALTRATSLVHEEPEGCAEVSGIGRHGMSSGTVHLMPLRVRIFTQEKEDAEIGYILVKHCTQNNSRNISFRETWVLEGKE